MTNLRPSPLLTPRERDVLACVKRGETAAKEIGRVLGISPRTAEIHRDSLCAKLGAKSVADLVRIALVGAGSSGNGA